jgi:hypothetical protein
VFSFSSIFVFSILSWMKIWNVCNVHFLFLSVIVLINFLLSCNMLISYLFSKGMNYIATCWIIFKGIFPGEFLYPTCYVEFKLLHHFSNHEVHNDNPDLMH